MWQVHKRTYVNGEFLSEAYSWIVHCDNGLFYDNVIISCLKDFIIIDITPYATIRDVQPWVVWAVSTANL